VSWLLDTNVLSELRKGDRANEGVRSWFASTGELEIFTSVLVVGELRRGVEQLRSRDEPAALAIEQWLNEMILSFSDRIVPIDEAIAQRWGRLNVPNPLPTVDGLLAATALEREMSVVTQNVRDFHRSGAKVFNPFTPKRSS
jgi:toxin FitB